MHIQSLPNGFASIISSCDNACIESTGGAERIGYCSMACAGQGFGQAVVIRTLSGGLYFPLYDYFRPYFRRVVCGTDDVDVISARTESKLQPGLPLSPSLLIVELYASRITGQKFFIALLSGNAAGAVR